MTDHVKACGQDIMEKQERFEDAYLRGRVFHAGCVGAPGDSGWQCESCRVGSLVVHWDSQRHDYYINTSAVGDTPPRLVVEILSYVGHTRGSNYMTA